MAEPQSEPAGVTSGMPLQDQAFWGAACHRLGVGPSPIPIDKLTTEGLTEALEYMRRPEAREAAKAAAADIRAVRSTAGLVGCGNGTGLAGLGAMAGVPGVTEQSRRRSERMP